MKVDEEKQVPTRSSGGLVKCKHPLPRNRLNLSLLGARLCWWLEDMSGSCWPFEVVNKGPVTAPCAPDMKAIGVSGHVSATIVLAAPGTGSPGHALGSAGGRSRISTYQVLGTLASFNGRAQSAPGLIHPLTLTFCGHPT